MIKRPEPGLYRTTKPYPGQEGAFPAGVLIYLGLEEGVPFVVRPGQNRRNRWFWGKPTQPLRASSWAETLKPLPSEGFYTLPYDIQVEGIDINVDMSLTSPGCPSGPEIMGEAEKQLRTVPGVGDVKINLIWSPPWTPDRIEPRVRTYLGF